MSEILVTGGAGFIGSHLVDELVKNNHNVTVIDDFSNGTMSNLNASKDSVNVIKFDISDYDWSKISVKPEIIFHLATHPRSFSLKDPHKNAEVNVLGTLNIFEFAKNNNSKVVYTSNSGICGDPQFLPVTEEHPEECKTPYDANKLLGELYAKIYFKIYGVYSTIFRLATVYGERQKPNSKLGWRPLIPQFVFDIEKGNKPIINWDGKQTRDLIHVSDVVKCLILGSESDKQGGEMFLLSTNTETSVNQVFEKICEVTGKKVEPIYKEKIPGDIRQMVLSYDKAKKAFGYEPKIDYVEGIKKYVNWFRENS